MHHSPPSTESLRPASARALPQHQLLQPQLLTPRQPQTLLRPQTPPQHYRSDLHELLRPQTPRQPQLPLQPQTPPRQPPQPQLPASALAHWAHPGRLSPPPQELRVAAPLPMLLGRYQRSAEPEKPPAGGAAPDLPSLAETFDNRLCAGLEAMRSLVEGLEERLERRVEQETRERIAAIGEVTDIVAKLGAHCVATAARQGSTYEELLSLKRQVAAPSPPSLLRSPLRPDTSMAEAVLATARTEARLEVLEDGVEVGRRGLEDVSPEPVPLLRRSAAPRARVPPTGWVAGMASPRCEGREVGARGGRGLDASPPRRAAPAARGGSWGAEWRAGAVRAPASAGWATE